MQQLVCGKLFFCADILHHLSCPPYTRQQIVLCLLYPLQIHHFLQKKATITFLPLRMTFLTLKCMYLDFMSQLKWDQTKYCSPHSPFIVFPRSHKLHWNMKEHDFGTLWKQYCTPSCSVLLQQILSCSFKSIADSLTLGL